MIKIKRFISTVLCVAMFMGAFVSCGKENSLKLVSCSGKVFATISSDSQLRNDKNKAYLQIAVDEAVKILCEKKGLNEEDARKQLYKNKYTVYTAFDQTVNEKLAKICSTKDKSFKVAAAITDLNANLVAVYSSDDGKKNTNFATAANRPCSAIKPLSVYAPAIDKGTINWSSRYEDSPYKYIKNLEGVMSPWPNNATHFYTEKYAYIYQAIKESINTVAVKCLTDYGVQNSLNFLQNSFDFPIAAEKTTAATLGEEEILGNIALGYLSDGVSTVDMAGYYQIFANGGKYEAPKTVLKICDKNGETLYEREHSPKQVIKNTTAEIMNRMLREVVSPGGTAEMVKCPEVAVAGKTGTDEDRNNNWFVGITPEYSCAFWHNYYLQNTAAQIFSDSINEIYSAKTNYRKVFAPAAKVAEIAYCTESGKQFKSGCSFIRMGYYTQDNVPSICDRH